MIVDPVENMIQQESVNPNRPVSEHTMFTMGASINYLLSRVFPVGTVLGSVLTDVQFKAQLGNPNPTTWDLSHGQNISGSHLQKVSGFTNAPDMRGAFLRSQNQGSGQNPDGNLPIGSFQGDQFASHDHNFNDPGHAHGFSHLIELFLPFYVPTSDVLGGYDSTFPSVFLPLLINPNVAGIQFLPNPLTGGNETRVKNITVNWFIRLN